MAQGTGFALSLGIIFATVVIAVAITTWVAPPIRESASAAPAQATEVIYRPQYPLVY
jgi:hypothetical protein